MPLLDPAHPRPRLGVSSCLLGELVRHDGGHKHDRLLTAWLGPHVEWVPVCPEAEVGMGTPRESIRLVGRPDAARLVAPASGTDWTGRMDAWADARLERLAALDLHGWVLKKGSPSCGLQRVSVYSEKGMPHRAGTGHFARRLQEHLPLLPLEEEGRLRDPALRESFLVRVFAFARWRALLAAGARAAGLVRFHTAHKLLLRAHSPRHYVELGRIVASQAELGLDASLERYAHRFMAALAVSPRVGTHVDTLTHLLGYLKTRLASDEKAEILRAIEDYREGLVPRIVPLTLLGHHFRRHPHDWVECQAYLDPYPRALATLPGAPGHGRYQVASR